MKFFKSVAIALTLGSFASFGQIVPIGPTSGGGYLLGDLVEVGINWGGHEGTWTHATFAPHERGPAFNDDVEHGFVANPAMDGWGNYDGDFFSPGTPENGWGLEIGGVNYHNNAKPEFWAGGPQQDIDGGLTDYFVTGDCIEVHWEGSILGIDIHIVYKLTTTELYYVTEVTLTNTTAADILNLYYYRNLDPDNNQQIGWGFVTTNTIQAQPNATCEIALVSAEQFNIWDSYFGLGAIGDQFRVTYGGFSNRDASNIWNGIAPLVGTTGSSSVGDQGISLAYYIDNLEAGTEETFQFTVVMSEDDVDAAIGSLYFFDYAGSGGSIDACNPVVDTVEICPGGTETISIDGPGAADYVWEWDPPTGLSTSVGPTTDASPDVTTTYTVTGTPAVGCLSSTIEKTIVVDILAPPAGPDSLDIGCNSGGIFDLNDYLIPAAVGAGAWEETSASPSGTFDPLAGTFDVGGIPATVYTFDYIVVALAPCPADTMTITITVNEQMNAGDGNSTELCNNPGNTVDMETLLSADAMAGGTWTETTPSGGFSGSVFDAEGLTPGTYEFTYTVAGIAPCPDDDTTFYVEILPPPVIEANITDPAGAIEVCQTDPITLTGSGAGPGGTYDWTGGVLDGVPFVQDVGTIVYTVTGTDANGCWATDDVTVIVWPFPSITITAEDYEGCEPFQVDFDEVTDPASVTCSWDFGDGLTGAGCGDMVHVYENAGYYDVTVQVEDIHGCISSITYDDMIHVLSSPVIDFEASETTICNPGCVDFTSLATTAEGSLATFEWDFGYGTGTGAYTQHCFQNPVSGDNYYDVKLTVTNSAGCVDSLTKEDYIRVVPTPVASFRWLPETPNILDSKVVFDNKSLWGDTYQWKFGDGSPYSDEFEPTHYYPETPGEYTVWLEVWSVENLCMDSIARTVIVEDVIMFYVPNVFTPDGDQYNEMFKPQFYSGIDPYNFHFTIFNRYGEIMFESFNPDFGWDGTYGDRGLAQDGTYIWSLEFMETNSEKMHKHRGHVTILK